MRTALLALALACSAAGPAVAQPGIRNADLREQPAGNLLQTVEALSRNAGPIWVGYRVPAHDRDWSACCHQCAAGPCGWCSLEESSGPRTTAVAAAPAAPIALESTDALILFRIAGRRVGEIRTFSESCAVDAGGRPFHWLTGVDPEQSVALLERFVSGPSDATDARGGRRVASGALAALAAHETPAALEALRRTAQRSSSSHARGQALFWLAQRAGQKAVDAIANAIEHDPDTDVKTRAVFALSQLPRDEGVPALIEVARTHRNPKVRRQAFFWLGQSADPRALRFFEEVLFSTPRSPRR